MPARVHVGLNAVFLRPEMGGLETYARALAPALLAERGDLELTVFVRPGTPASDWPGAARLVSHPLVGRRYTSMASEAFLLGRVAARERVDVLHSLGMTGPLRARMAH